MKTIIAGGRDITQYSILRMAVGLCPFKVTEVVCGKARGADFLGEVYAAVQDIPIHYYPADWDKHGKSAGYIRNKEMAENAEALIALWDGKSKGTRHMIELAYAWYLDVYIYRVDMSAEDNVKYNKEVSARKAWGEKILAGS